MTDLRANWAAMVQREGSEAAARARLARLLRAAADRVEQGGAPDIYGCDAVCDGPVAILTVALAPPGV